MNTLLLDLARWDLTVDARGNIAMASNPYAPAQDAASELRLFRGELWYDRARGVPYFERILGHLPSVEFMKAQFVAAVVQVPDVASATAFITEFVNRAMRGQVQITLTSDAQLTIALNQPGALPWYINAVDVPYPFTLYNGQVQ